MILNIKEVFAVQAWQLVQTTIDYIESHLDENTSIESLAKMASLSPFYYQRLFSQLVGKPVCEYIKLRRLARVSERLAAEDTRILDIALECGFSSHETLTRAFKLAYGQTPAQFRKNPTFLNQFDKPDLSLRYTMIDEGVPLVSEGLVLEFNRKKLERPIRFMGVEGYVPIEGQMPLGKATGVDLPGAVWQRFHEQKDSIPSAQNARNIGVAYLGDAPAGSFTYFAGTEVAPGAQDPTFKTFELPAREYVVCGFEAESFGELVGAALNKAVVYSQQWIKAHDLTMQAYSPEIYYSRDAEGTYMELWMPV